MHLFASGDGLKALYEIYAVFFGALILLASAGFGALSWFTAFRPPSTSLGLFGRSLLGVAGVVAFLFGGLLVVSGLDLATLESPLVVVVLLLALVFLVIECFVAGVLYRQANAARPSPWARALSAVSFVLGGLLALATSLVVVAVLADAFGPKSDAVVDSREVVRYSHGCSAGDASDCNMLGLRRQFGEGTPRAPEAAASAFDRACELGATIGCDNLAALYERGDALPKDETRAKAARARAKSLPSAALNAAP